MVALPRLVIGAPSTGQGKTTIATGLMAALRAEGLEVSGHKVGPDYIDPGYHALATGRPGRNLDPHLVGEERVAPLLLHGAEGADLAVIEGVMGLHDGRLGTDGFASTAHVARLTGSPVVLVVDIARMSRTAAAIAGGVARFDPGVAVAGVVLNRATPGRNTVEVGRALEAVGLPVLGALPPDDSLAAPSRHLGLVPVAERAESTEMVQRLGQQVARHLDLSVLRDVARAAPPLDARPWRPTDHVTASGRGRPLVAVSGGRAFTFRYPETDELLRAAGCEVVVVDPLTDTSLPEGIAGIYLGGGFPEMYAGELAANRGFLSALRQAVAAGVPTVAECAGLLYLARSLDGVPMAGALPVEAGMSPRLTLRYPEAIAASDGLLTRTGERFTGHEFHRTTTEPTAGAAPAWLIEGHPTGFSSETWHASYLHLHWAGYPLLAQRFADAAHAYRQRPTEVAADGGGAAFVRSVEPVPVGALDGSVSVTDPVTDPLRHHGDREIGEGLLDFAVNVHEAPRPQWLDGALHAAVDAATTYPDDRRAKAALAAFHKVAVGEVLPTSGAAEAFSLIARARPWQHPVVVHPQFTEPHAALEAAGHRVTTVECREDAGFALVPGDVPESADLVVVGNPTNPTGVLHPAHVIAGLIAPGRLVVVDEAFLVSVPGEAESLVGSVRPGLLVLRSLTKLWSIPGLRAGYVVGDDAVVADLAAQQSPWSVSTPALAAIEACCTPEARAERDRRAATVAQWRAHLESELAGRGFDFVQSSAPFVLARIGAGARIRLRENGIAVRRADTFPGLDDTWVRIAVRNPAATGALLAALDRLPIPQPAS